MILLNLKDGLGNQIFQYAAAHALASELNVPLKLDLVRFKKDKLRKYGLCHFKIDENLATSREIFLFNLNCLLKTIRSLLKGKYRSCQYRERSMDYDPDFFNLKANTRIEGYFQTEKYFSKISSVLRNQLMVKYLPDPINQSFLDRIFSTQSVSLHVRRGDYLSNPKNLAKHGICDLSYYNSAVSYVKERVNNPHFFVFSDDMPWVKENLNLGDCPVEYVEHNDLRDYEDLRLMYSCRHNIIANSSFSWWGAWLNPNPDKIVIAPATWFRSLDKSSDLLPDRWIKF